MTSSGGILTIGVAVVLAYLGLYEAAIYFSPKMSFEFKVDSERSVGHALNLNIDVTVAMSCDYVRADLVDSSGESMQLENVFKKERKPVFEIMHAHKLHEFTDTASETNIHHVREKIKLASGHDHHDHNGQASSSSAASSSDQPTEACRITGEVKLNKVAGMLHFTAAGHGYWGQHTPHEKINFTHRVDSFSFGQYYPSLINPLDNSYELASDNFDTFKYYISVVPTTYIDKNRGNPLIYLSSLSTIFPSAESILYTNQYALTEYKQTGAKTPGIFMKYEIEAISVSVIEEMQTTFSHFLVRLCGIAGGIFVTVGIIHSTCLWIWNMIFPDLEKKRRIQKMKEDLLDLDSSGRPLLYETPLTSPVKETSPFQFPPSYQMMDTNNDDGNFSVPSSPFDGPRITTTSPGRGMGMGSMRQPAHHHHQLSYSSANGDGESPHSANSYTSASSSPTRPSFPFPLSINTATADNKKD